MRNRLLLPLWLLLIVLRCGPAFAGVEQLTEAEFRALSKELALKVNLFRDVWATDPKAEFYGGTSRDYLYWLKGKFREAKTKEEAQSIAQRLKARGSIDIREFIIGGSDVDIISHSPLSIDPNRYGVRKIDSHGANYFDPGTETWANEINQGHIPAEKIRLGAGGTIPVPELGDGVKEIYNGKLTIQFADPAAFAETKYAKEKINHPILLALRYLRLQAMNYYQEHGAGLPDKKLLLSGMDEKSNAAVRKVISESLTTHDLAPYLKNDRFKSWLNGTIQKSFLSYTNQTAALEILREFGVDKLPGSYTEVEPVNQYVFQQYRDEKAIEASLKKYGVDPKKFYQPAAKFFPDGQLYHGTKTEAGFRSILFQGVLGSENGSAGPGLYGVSESHQEFSVNWGGSKDRLIRFPVKPEARIVDVKSGEGKRVLQKMNGDLEAFAKEFGVDIIRYEYGSTDAYVVKNSTALGRPQGVHRELLHFEEMIERLRQSKTPAERIGLLQLNALSQEDTELLHRDFPKLSKEALDWLLARKNPTGDATLDHSAILSIAKKEMYRLAESNDPAVLEKLAKATRPLSMNTLKAILDAPEPLLNKIVTELAADIKGERHRIYQEGFEHLFSDPKSVRLGPLLDQYLKHAGHSRRYNFTQMFAYPHMVAMEKQVLTLLDIGEPNIHDQLAVHIFTRPSAIHYPKAFEAWLKASNVSGNHEYYVGDLLKSAYLKESEVYTKLVMDHLTRPYPAKIGEFLRSLPAEKRQELLPIALKNMNPSRQISFLNNMYVRQGQEAFADMKTLSPWEKKFVWDIWQKMPDKTQAGLAPLIMPQIQDLPAEQRSVHYARLMADLDYGNELNTFYYYFQLPANERPPELWKAIRPFLQKKEYFSTLARYGNFTDELPEREILDALSTASRSLTQENLKGLTLPRDQQLLLKMLRNPANAGNQALTKSIIEGALLDPKAAESEEVAVQLLRGSSKINDSAMEKLFAANHTKNWHKAQLLYLEKTQGWIPNANQLAAINTPEGREKIRAAILEDKYRWQKKIFLNRHFPAEGGKVSGLKGFMLDCAAGFAKLR